MLQLEQQAYKLVRRELRIRHGLSKRAPTGLTHSLHAPLHSLSRAFCSADSLGWYASGCLPIISATQTLRMRSAAAFRIPNFLQNLFGEGVLSASFIPVYARLRAEERHEEATQLAEAIFAILFFITSLLTLAGVFATPWLIDAIAPGFHGEKRQLTIRLVQILFPGAALLVISAWCLGILNSHRKFFLSYAAPVIWNVAHNHGPALEGWTRDRASIGDHISRSLPSSAAACSLRCSCRR